MLDTFKTYNYMHVCERVTLCIFYSLLATILHLQTREHQSQLDAFEHIDQGLPFGATLKSRA